MDVHFCFSFPVGLLALENSSPHFFLFLKKRLCSFAISQQQWKEVCMNLQKELLSEANCNSQLPLKGIVKAGIVRAVWALFPRLRTCAALASRSSTLFDLMSVGIIMGTFR